MSQLIEPTYTRLKSNSNKSDKEKDARKLIRLLGEEPHIELSSFQFIKVDEFFSKPYRKLENTAGSSDNAIST
ncbi:MAG: hypothetical protein ACXWC7_17685 [Chitinophagaceae bacterium]